MKDTSHSRWPAVIRLLVCGAAVLWLWKNNDPAQLRSVLAEADWRLALLGLAAFGPAPVLIALRLKWLLAVHRIHLTLLDAVKVTFAGNFLIQALPVGTYGGDAVKAYYVARDTPYKHEAVTVVFFDRVIGVVGLVLMSGIMVLVNWNDPALAVWGPRIGLMVAVLLVGTALYFSTRVRRVLRLQQIIARLPFASHLQRIDHAVFEFRHHGRSVLACLVLTGVLQTISVLAVFLGGWALGLIDSSPTRSFLVYLAYTPICFLSGILPLGVMEVIYGQFFSQVAGFGSLEAATFLSLFTRLMQLVWSLPGGLLILTGRFSATPPAQLAGDEPADSSLSPEASTAVLPASPAAPRV
jgi:hypothetical protein